MIHDMVGSAKTYAGAAVNTIYARSKRMGQPTLLTQSQVPYIMRQFCRDKDKTRHSPSPKTGPTEDLYTFLENTTAKTGPTEDLYTFLENTGASYVSLLQKQDGDRRTRVHPMFPYSRSRTETTTISKLASTNCASWIMM